MHLALLLGALPNGAGGCRTDVESEGLPGDWAARLVWVGVRAGRVVVGELGYAVGGYSGGCARVDEGLAW